MQGKSAHDQMTPEGKSENRDCNRLPTPTTGSATSGKLTLKPTIMNPLIVHTDSGGDSSIVQQRHQVPLVDQNPGTALRGCCLQFQKSGRLEKIICSYQRHTLAPWPGMASSDPALQICRNVSPPHQPRQNMHTGRSFQAHHLLRSTCSDKAAGKEKCADYL